MKEGVAGYVFLVLEAAQLNGEAVTVTVVRPGRGDVEGWGLRLLLLFVPEMVAGEAAVPELAMEEVVMELLPNEEVLNAVPKNTAETTVEVKPLLTLAEEGKTTNESQLGTSNATVPLIVMK